MIAARARRRLPWLAALLALCLAPAALLAQDVIYKTDGTKLRGKILSETTRGIKIQTLGGTFTIRKDEVARVERDGDVWKALAARQAKLSEHDADGWYRLGVWANDQELYPQAIDCFNRVLEIDPDHADARWELGYRRWNGHWVGEQDYYEAQGYVRFEDRWVSREDYSKLEAGLVEVDGHWVTPPAADEPARGTTAAPVRAAARPGKSETERGGASNKPEGGERAPARPRVAGWRPAVGQVGLPPLSADEREKQLEAARASGGWKQAYSSKCYYDFYSNGDLDEVKALARTMDLMCEEYKRIFKFDQDLTRPFPVHLYGSQGEFMQRTGKGPGVGGFYDGHRIVGFHGNTGALTTETVLFHEGTHQFQGLVLGANMWRAKIWLIEGLAVFFEASEVEGKRLKTGAIPTSRLQNVRRAIQSGNYVHLRDLIRLDQAQFGALHYAHAWSLIYFLVNGTKGGKKRFVEYWERTKEGGHDPVALFEELFDRPMDEIEEGWKQYVLQLQ